MDLYSLHLRATDYGCLPSELLLIDFRVLAYAFDRWCHLYGRKVDALLDEKEEIKRKDQVIGHKPKYDFETALAKAAGDKKQRSRGFATLFAPLEVPGAPSEIIITG